MTAVGWLIAIHLVCLVVETLFPAIIPVFEFRPHQVFRDWQWWRFVTGVFFFAAGLQSDGRFCVPCLLVFIYLVGGDLERLYGRRNLLLFYVCAGVFANLVWGISVVVGIFADDTVAWHTPQRTSAAVSGALFLFALHFPGKLVRLARILPMPGWAIPLLYLTVDMTFCSPAPWTLILPAHLGAGMFALCFRQFYPIFTRVAADLQDRLRRWRRNPRDSQDARDEKMEGACETQEPAMGDAAFDARLDEVLKKISRTGTISLNESERRLLDAASQRFRDRKT